MGISLKYALVLPTFVSLVGLFWFQKRQKKRNCTVAAKTIPKSNENSDVNELVQLESDIPPPDESHADMKDNSLIAIKNTDLGSATDSCSGVHRVEVPLKVEVYKALAVEQENETAEPEEEEALHFEDALPSMENLVCFVEKPVIKTAHFDVPWLDRDEVADTKETAATENNGLCDKDNEEEEDEDEKIEKNLGMNKSDHDDELSDDSGVETKGQKSSVSRSSATSKCESDYNSDTDVTQHHDVGGDGDSDTEAAMSGVELDENAAGVAVENHIEAVKIICDDVKNLEQTAKKDAPASWADEVRTAEEEEKADLIQCESGIESIVEEVQASNDAITEQPSASEQPSTVAPLEQEVVEDVQIYEAEQSTIFEFPREFCGLLIGRKGSNIDKIVRKSNTKIYVESSGGERQFVTIVGTESNIKKAVDILKEMFPSESYPGVDFGAPVPLNFVDLAGHAQQLCMTATMEQVRVTSVVSPNHLFFHRILHRSYRALDNFSINLDSAYCNPLTAPPLPLPQPIRDNTLCVAKISGKHFRAVILCRRSSLYKIKFVDYGGFAYLSQENLKPILPGYINYPFQAIECRLANVFPLPEGRGFTKEAMQFVEQSVKDSYLVANVRWYKRNGVPCVDLFRQDCSNNTMSNIGKEAASRGLVSYSERN